MNGDLKVWRAISISTILGAVAWAAVIYLGWRIFQ